MHLVDSMAVVRLPVTEVTREAVVERATFVLAPVCPIVLSLQVVVEALVVTPERQVEWEAV